MAVTGACKTIKDLQPRKKRKEWLEQVPRDSYPIHVLVFAFFASFVVEIALLPASVGGAWDYMVEHEQMHISFSCPSYSCHCVWSGRKM